MRLKYRVSLAVISILMVMTLFVSSSYALWSVTEYQKNENIIESGCFDIKLESVGSSINLDNTYPMNDEKGKKLQPYVFKVKNICSVDAKYTLYLSELKPTSAKGTSTSKISSFIKVALTKGNQSVITTQKIADAQTTTNENKLVKASGVQGLDFSGKEIENTYILTTGTLEGTQDGQEGGEETFELRLWIDESATTDIAGQTFEAGISAIAYATDLSQEEGS